MPPSKYTDEPEEEGVALLSTVHDSDSDGDDEVLPPPPPPAAPDDDDVPLQPSGTAPTPALRDTRFDQPPPSPWKRAALLLIIALLFFLAFRLKASGVGKEKVVHATRYSNEYKFRPAASPIITQTLKDGRLRVRGAAPTASPTVVPVLPKTKAKKAKKRAGGQNSKRKTQRKKAGKSKNKAGNA